MSKEKKKKRKLQKTAQAGSGYLFLFPVFFILAFVPLIVYLKVIPLDGAALYYWLGEFNWDFFSYYKAVFFLIPTVAAVVIFIIFKQRFTIKKSAIYFPMAIYALLILLSAVFSEYKEISFFGFPDRYEGAFVLLAYLAIAFITLNIVQNENHIRLLLNCLFISASIIGVLGIFQFFGFDLLRSEVGKLLIFPVNYRHLAEEFTFVFEKNTIYATLYNPNYVGSYSAMLLPPSVVIYYYAQEKNHIYAYFVFSCLMFATLVGSNSRAGAVGVSFAFLILFFFYYRIVIANWKRSIALLLGFMIIFAVLNVVSGGKTFKKMASIVPTYFDDEASEVKGPELKDIVLGKKDLQFKFKNEKLVFVYKDGLIEIENEEGKKLNYHFDEDEELLMFNEEPFQSCGFMIWEKENMLGVNIDSKNIYFTIDQDGFKVVNHRKEAVILEHAEAWGFEGKEKLGSGRGYIWSRSLPLLKNTFFLGYGPDTFPVYFPQHDYFAKMIYMGNPYDLVDKPHNIYLQAAINTGLISLIAMLVMLGIYLFDCVRLYYKKDFNNFYCIIGFAVFLSVTGYSVAGFFNDSVVSVAPIFWVLFGLGLALNHMLQKGDRKS